jgi:pimeloyl-ACP methyl ester carboxylesterase
MPRPVAVIFVHGIANFEKDYHKPMQALIERALPKAVAEQVTFRAVHWAEPVRKRQKTYMDAVQRAGLFRITPFRSLVVEGLGDAAAYQKTEQFQNSSYFDIQDRLRTVLDELDQDGLPDRPLIFVGHSLGCHIISSFAWDINSVKQMPDALLQKLTDADNQYLVEFVKYLRGGLS